MTTNDDSRLPERDNESTAGSTGSSSSMSQDFKIKLRTSTREKLAKFNALRGEFLRVSGCLVGCLATGGVSTACLFSVMNAL